MVQSVRLVIDQGRTMDVAKSLGVSESVLSHWKH